MDKVLAKLEAMTWPYADRDPAALAELGQRIAEVGRRADLVTYADAVRGLTFRLANVDDGQPFELGVPEWRDIDRAVLGDFLGRLCVESYRRAGFLASALVTSRETSEPSEGFWNLVAAADLYQSKSPSRRLLFWSEEVRKAPDWYADNQW
jgi:hypothetical protein